MGRNDQVLNAVSWKQSLHLGPIIWGNRICHGGCGLKRLQKKARFQSLLFSNRLRSCFFYFSKEVWSVECWNHHLHGICLYLGCQPTGSPLNPVVVAAPRHGTLEQGKGTHDWRWDARMLGAQVLHFFWRCGTFRVLWFWFGWEFFVLQWNYHSACFWLFLFASLPDSVEARFFYVLQENTEGAIFHLWFFTCDILKKCEQNSSTLIWHFGNLWQSHPYIAVSFQLVRAVPPVFLGGWESLPLILFGVMVWGLCDPEWAPGYDERSCSTGRSQGKHPQILSFILFGSHFRMNNI